MRALGGEEWADWLRRARPRRARRDRHALARPAPARRGARCAQPRSPTRPRSRLTRRSSRSTDSPRWRAGARRAGLDARAVRLRGGGEPHVAVVDYGAQALDHPPARKGGSVRDGRPAHLLGRRARAASTASSSRTAPGTRSRSTRRTTIVRELLGPRPVLGICLGHQLLGLATGHETYKLPFGIAARTIRFSSAGPAGPRHEPEPRLRGRPSESARGDVRLALRRNGRGLRVPRAARPLGAVPSRGRPGPARRLADPRALGRGAPPLVPGATTSSRSASSGPGRSSSARPANSTTRAARR